jgi:hypothetical protein
LQSFGGNVKAVWKSSVDVLFKHSWSVGAIDHILQRFDAFKGSRPINVPRAKDAALWEVLAVMLKAGYIDQNKVLEKLFNCSLLHAMTPLALALKQQGVKLPTDQLTTRFMDGVSDPDTKTLETIAAVDPNWVCRDVIDSALAYGFYDFQPQWRPLLHIRKVKVILAFNPSFEVIHVVVQKALDHNFMDIADLASSRLPSDYRNGIFTSYIGVSTNDRSVDLVQGLLSIKHGPDQKVIDDAFTTASDADDGELVKTFLNYPRTASQEVIDAAFIAVVKKSNQWPLIRLFLEAKAKPSIPVLRHVYAHAKSGSRLNRKLSEVLTSASPMPTERK